jgi:anti-sigma factor RsiW
MVADYTVRMVRHLPGGENNLAAVLDSVPFAVRPISATGTQVIGAWTTAIRGQPAAAIAYRWRDRVVVQYVVSDSLFFHHRDVRAAVAARGLYRASDGALGVLAWPDSGSGSVLVGSLAPDELARLHT